MDDVLVCASSGTGPCYVNSDGKVHYVLSGMHCSTVRAAGSSIAGRAATCDVDVKSRQSRVSVAMQIAEPQAAGGVGACMNQERTRISSNWQSSGN